MSLRLTFNKCNFYFQTKQNKKTKHDLVYEQWVLYVVNNRALYSKLMRRLKLSISTQLFH